MVSVTASQGDVHIRRWRLLIWNTFCLPDRKCKQSKAAIFGWLQCCYIQVLTHILSDYMTRWAQHRCTPYIKDLYVVINLCASPPMSQILTEEEDASSGLGCCFLSYKIWSTHHHLHNSSIKTTLTFPTAEPGQCSLTIVLVVACYDHQLAQWTETEANGSAEWDHATLTGGGFDPPGASC